VSGSERRVGSALGAALGVTALVLVGANPRAQTGAPPTPTFRTNTELVLVNVVARDKSGALVRGLTRDDFIVLEDGKPQTVVRSEFEELDRPSPAAPVEAGAPNLRGGSARPILGSSANSAPSAVRAGVELHDRRLMVLFFDLTSMQQDETLRVVDASRQYIESRLTPADLVAVVSLSTSWQVVQDFTDNRESLRKAIDSLDPNGGQGFEAGATGDSDGTADNGASFTPDETELNIFGIDRRLEALRAIVDALSGIEQRKSIVYFSSGMSQSGLDNRVQLRTVIDRAVRANVAIYASDARGLQAMVPGGDATSASVRGTGAFSGEAMAGQFDRLAASQDTLTTLAEDTGGRALLDENEIGRVFDQVIADTSAYYVLAYSSTNPARDGKYRRITVRTRRPGVLLEYRAGYYAPRDFAHSRRDDREQQLTDALQSDLSPTDLHVYLEAAYFRMEENRYSVPVSIVVPGSEVPFARTGRQDRATLDVLGGVIDERRRPVARVRDTVTLRVEGATNVRRKTVQYQTSFELPPGTYRLKVIVRENAQGTMGSYETELRVPDMRRQPLKVSAVVIGSRVEPDEGRGIRALVHDGLALVPNVVHAVSRAQHLYFQYEVYEPAIQSGTGASGNAVRLITSLTFFRNGVRVYETPLTELGEISDPERRASVFRLDVPASLLEPGRYTCQVNVIDDVAGTFAFPRLMVFVVR
jgi:VWFA-related protein